MHDIGLGFGMDVIAHMPHEHQLAQHDIGIGQIGNGHGDRTEPADLVLGRHRAFRPGMRRAMPAVIDKAQTLLLRVFEIESLAPVALDNLARPHLLIGEALLPPQETRLAIHAQGSIGNRVVAAPLRPRPEIEEGQIAAGRSEAVAIKEVIGRNIVLIHRLLDQPHAHDLRVETQIARRVGGDGGQMMDAGELHVDVRVGPCAM